MAFIPNASYSPDFAPIEHTFSMVKREFKAIRLNAILNGDKVKVKTLLKRAFKLPTIENIRNQILHAHKAIN